MKIQTKIALLFTLVCTLTIVALSCAIYYFAKENAFQDFYTRLQLRAIIAAKATLDSNIENATVYEQVRNEHLQRLPQEKEYIIRIDSLQAPDKNALYSEVPVSFFNDIVTQKNASYRKNYHFYRGIYYNTGKDNYAVIISAEHTYARNFLSSLKAILITGDIVAAVIVFTIGILFSKEVLAPIRSIALEVKKINATSLHKRLSIKKGNDEITELGNTFNNMLGRLETSFETQNNFVSNASHELNTPLTVIIGEAEFALTKTRTPDQYQKGLRVILSQSEKLKNLTKSLLELAQSGFSGNLSSEAVKVSELLQNVQKLSSDIYPDCHLETDSSLQPADTGRLIIKGNFHLLELCLSNIVLNACKYSNGGKVTLAVASSDRHVVFIVKDKGIGIPEQDMPHIFDPFFRASNAKSSKGYGIGLPLAQNIIKLHNAVISISSKEGEGTEVVVKFPKEI